MSNRTSRRSFLGSLIAGQAIAVLACRQGEGEFADSIAGSLKIERVEVTSPDPDRWIRDLDALVKRRLSESRGPA